MPKECPKCSNDMFGVMKRVPQQPTASCRNYEHYHVENLYTCDSCKYSFVEPNCTPTKVEKWKD